MIGLAVGLIFVLAMGGTAAAATIIAGRRRPTPAEPPIPLVLKPLHDVTVHLTPDDTIQGVLRETLPDGLVLSAARFLDTETPVPLAGDIFIPAARVRFVQIGVPQADA